MDYSTVCTETLKEIERHWSSEYLYARKTMPDEFLHFDDNGDRIQSEGKRRDVQRVEDILIRVRSELQKRI